ncbi:hypothetical protein ABTA48_19625, partial [Acinetobacter baumannii]
TFFAPEMPPPENVNEFSTASAFEMSLVIWLTLAAAVAVLFVVLTELCVSFAQMRVTAQVVPTTAAVMPEVTAISKIVNARFRLDFMGS